jgi:hypothetical protein
MAALSIRLALEEICEYRIDVRQRRHVSDGCPPRRLDERG